MTRSPSLAVASAALFVALSTTAMAQPQDTGGLSVDYNVVAVSDYRYRGLSLSDEKPALQADATVSTPGGWYAGTRASTIAEIGVGPDGDGSKVEVDYLVGRSFSLGAYDFDAAVSGYIYPDGTDVNFAEIPVSVSRTAGAWTWSLGAVYTPRQKLAVPSDNRYVSGTVTWQAPQQPWQVSARVGYEDGAFAPDGKVDWEVGAARTVGPVTLGLSYIDTDDSSVDAALVASVKAGF